MAAHAEVRDDRQLHVEAGVWSLDGQRYVRTSLVQDLKQVTKSDEANLKNSYSSIAVPLGNSDCEEYGMAHTAGMRLAQKLCENGAQTILQEAKLQVEEMRKSSSN